MILIYVINAVMGDNYDFCAIKDYVTVIVADSNIDSYQGIKSSNKVFAIIEKLYGLSSRRRKCRYD